jgi:mRNA interferase HigB
MWIRRQWSFFSNTWPSRLKDDAAVLTNRQHRANIYPVRVIKQSFLRRLAAVHPSSRSAVEDWLVIAKHARWKHFADIRRVFPHADPVRVKSDNVVTVFNISGNNYRLITAVHYQTQLIFILRFLTHAEYSKGRWKLDL